MSWTVPDEGDERSLDPDDRWRDARRIVDRCGSESPQLMSSAWPPPPRSLSLIQDAPDFSAPGVGQRDIGHASLIPASGPDRAPSAVIGLPHERRHGASFGKRRWRSS
jgi:hypothetical protein